MGSSGLVNLRQVRIEVDWDRSNQRPSGRTIHIWRPHIVKPNIMRITELKIETRHHLIDHHAPPRLVHTLVQLG